jgi:dihydroorotate dehydrogenase electron transfer subunit
MVQCDATVTHTDQIGPFRHIRLEVPQIAPGLSAGRFALADLGDYLRVPLFPAQLDRDSFDVLVEPDHPAATLQVGTWVNLIGPLGRGYELPHQARKVLLVADVPRLPVLLPLTHQRRTSVKEPQVSIALLLSATRARDLYPIHLLPPSLEVKIATGDGQVGHTGSVLDLLPDMVPWADCICIAADPEMYPAMADTVLRASGPGGLAPYRAQRPHRFAGKQIDALVVPPMPCGVGACQACAVSNRRAPKLACTDGPVFDLLRLV